MGREPTVKSIRSFVSEMIGRSVAAVTNLYKSQTSVDATQTDYAFWDALRRGKKATYTLGGLFARPIVHHIVAWTLGKGLAVTCEHEATKEALNEFLRRNRQLILDWVTEGKALGDSYLVVNPDASLTLVPPSQMEITTDDLDYRRVLAYTITTNLERATITDEYRLDGRTIMIKKRGEKPLNTAVDGVSNAPEQTLTYANLVGRLPVAHYANYRGSNELYGHPEYEALLGVFAEYDDVLTKALQGVKLMGNPIPTIEEDDDPEETRTDLATGTRTYTDEEGMQQTVPVVDFNSLDMVIVKGKFSLKSPQPFTDDTWRMLKNLFYLMLEHSNVPEWVWGGAIASSKASVDAQMPAWERFIDWQREILEPLLLDLMRTWLLFQAYLEPGLDTEAEIGLQWPSLTDKNEEIELKKIQFAREDGMLDRATGLSLLDLVEDPARAVEDAATEAEQGAADFERRTDRAIDRLAGTPEPEEDGAIDEEAA